MLIMIIQAYHHTYHFSTEFFALVTMLFLSSFHDACVHTCSHVSVTCIKSRVCHVHTFTCISGVHHPSIMCISRVSFGDGIRTVFKRNEVTSLRWSTEISFAQERAIRPPIRILF